MKHYRDLLATPSVSRILASTLLGRLPLGMSALALVLTVRDHGGSFALAGLTSAALTFSNAASNPIQGRLVTRLGPTVVVSVSAVANSAALIAIGIAAQIGVSGIVLVIMAVATGSLVPPISACSRGLWPHVVSDRRLLDAAYSLDAISQELLWTSGPLLVALATAVAFPILGLWLAGLFTAVGGLWFASTPAVRSAPRATVQQPEARRPIANIETALLLWVVGCAGIADGSLSLGLTALASQLGAPAASGALLAMLSLGSVIGGLLHGGRTWSQSLWWRLRALLAASGLLALPLCLATDIPLALVLSVVAGLGWASLMSCQFALVSLSTSPSARTEMFSWNTSALVVGIAIGTFLAGIAERPLGSSGGFAITATACLVAATTTLAVRPSERPVMLTN